MLVRKKFVGGNWKMNLTLSQAHALARAVASGLAGRNNVDTAIFPAFVHLAEVASVLRSVQGHAVQLGAQDFYYQPDGAYTGEISLAMLKDLGVEVVLVGHSERRHVIGETDVLINHKVRAALEAGLQVIICVGEKIEQRQAGMTDQVNVAQTLYALAGVRPEQMNRVTIAYEPVWAIGTGQNATPQDAQAAHQAIRSALAHMYGPEIAQAVRIQYGGSVKSSIAADLFAQPDIDGGLIGGASLKAEEFLAIVRAAGQPASC